MSNLANAAGISVLAVKRIQDGETKAASDAALAAIQDAFETQGVCFLADDGRGPGLRLKRR